MPVMDQKFTSKKGDFSNNEMDDFSSKPEIPNVWINWKFNSILPKKER